ncbi:response regulator transcription factor [Aquirufa regiilacus]|jgi:DNA-binding response OmpR family regulator|uniref:Response regulator transcription factor n=1 Tax=Aquirufa regiilacus TaxID=3024868 RepID=A0ABU3TNK9_9BACT|nr:response regulator transcription factor [Aquirufa sp. LEOWEIH-7C]MDU0807439.1 response regulator transcription factor [Aquirufa sp. LEOWEIH-7C]
MATNPSILLAEDDPNLGLLLAEFLKKKGYEVAWAHDGDQALDLFVKGHFDLCVFDVMMPKKDGFSLAKDIRATHLDVPIIFLTAKSMEEDTLQGFKVGADDYLTKPFSMDVLVARMEAVLRRTHSDKSLPALADEIALGDFLYYPAKLRLVFQGNEQKFTPKENELMKLLCENLGRPVSRSYALKLIWGDDTYFNARSMDVYMTKLRKLLKEDPRVQLMNLHGEGFRLSVD